MTVPAPLSVASSAMLRSVGAPNGSETSSAATKMMTLTGPMLAALLHQVRCNPGYPGVIGGGMDDAIRRVR